MDVSDMNFYARLDAMRQIDHLKPEMDLETENKILLTIINYLKRFNYED